MDRRPLPRHIALLAIIGPVAISGAAEAAPICLSIRDMVATEPQNDGRAILFTMRDGSEWRNDLQGRCSDLKFNGFNWIVPNADYAVCENQQSLQVQHSGQVCVLGKFSQIKLRR